MWYCQSLLEAEVLVLALHLLLAAISVLSALGCPQPSLSFSVGLQK